MILFYVALSVELYIIYNGTAQLIETSKMYSQQWKPAMYPNDFTDHHREK